MDSKKQLSFFLSMVLLKGFCTLLKKMSREFTHLFLCLLNVILVSLFP